MSPGEEQGETKLEGNETWGKPGSSEHESLRFEPNKIPRGRAEPCRGPDEGPVLHWWAIGYLLGFEVGDE